ncbi:hypothetical protein [Komagataeibacter intermedius]|uniref:hypothetical protein n=1 Tax=Komagataeibacter intermedius TaxID=66229 RepID=UPI003B430EFC
MTHAQVEQQTASENNPAQITLLKIREWGACSGGRDWFREKFPQGGTYGEVMTGLYADKRYSDARWLADKAFDVKNISADFIESDVRSIIAATEGIDVDPGNYAQAAFSGYDARAAFSGYGARAAFSGNDAQAAFSGYGAQAAFSGYDARAAFSGYGARAAFSGNDAQAAFSGYGAQAAFSGYGARAAFSGYRARAGFSGNYAQAAFSGDGARAAFSGNDARAGFSGNYAQAAFSGDGARAECTGENATIVFAGLNGSVILGEGGAANLTWNDGTRDRFVHLYEGEDGIEAGVLYTVKDGKVVRA